MSLPRLTLLVGGGGVGKTTLSSALALALAGGGARVGLLGIDPARRLRSALGLARLGERGALVPVPRGQLRAAVLCPEDSLRRWVAEACRDDDTRARLARNPYFLALADRLASATDAIASVRAAEWAEEDPALEHLVVDTAPGPAAVQFLARPDKLLAFFDGQLVRWARRLSRIGSLRRGGALLGRLSRLSGADALADFGDFFRLVDDAVARMVTRLESARRWLAAPGTSVIVVAGVSDDSAAVARQLVRALAELRQVPALAVLNRALPPALLAEAEGLVAAAAPPARPLARYVAAYARAQAATQARLAEDFARVVVLEDAPALGGPAHLEALARLGERLAAALTEPRGARAAP